MDLKEYFQNHQGFQHKSGIFFQKDFTHPSVFEAHYLSLRGQEGRIYDDQQLSLLPVVPRGHPLQMEWSVRKDSANKLASHLRNKRFTNLVEIGCGNGWLLHYLHDLLDIECVGIDLNVKELEQGARVFGNQEGLVFVHVDILSETFQEAFADVIVMASALQYFPDLASLLNRLLKLLRPSGEIHIIDSPFYTREEALLAKDRSDNYFRMAGAPDMNNLYFHHTWGSLQNFEHQIMHDPTTLPNKIRRLYLPKSPFPWIKISST